MELFKSFINFGAYAALSFSFVAAYLNLNKIWKRKHIPEVANSVSITGNFIDLVPALFFTTNFLLAAQWQGFIDGLIWIVEATVLIAIGTGFWVAGNRGVGFWRRVKRALKLEKSEVGYLVKSFFRPASAELVLEILTRFAYLDRDLESRERELIEAFAAQWHLKWELGEHQQLGELSRPGALLEARAAVERYLETSPPRDQVGQLIDILQSLVGIDEQVHEQEKLVLDETAGLLSDYLGAGEPRDEIAVVIVPQSRAQDEAIAALLERPAKTQIAGGSAYRVGSFYTAEYASAICEQYRALGFFTIDVRTPASAPAGA